MAANSNEAERDWVFFSCRVGRAFDERLNNHIVKVGRMTTHKVTKNRWVEAAMKKKMDREKGLLSVDIPKECRINLKISKAFSTDIDEQVSRMKEFKSSYSKRRWVIEAIEEQLVEEGQQVDQWRSEHARRQEYPEDAEI